MNGILKLQKSAGGVLLPKSAVKFEKYLMGEVSEPQVLLAYNHGMLISLL